MYNLLGSLENKMQVLIYKFITIDHSVTWSNTLALVWENKLRSNHWHCYLRSGHEWETEGHITKITIVIAPNSNSKFFHVITNYWVKLCDKNFYSVTFGAHNDRPWYFNKALILGNDVIMNMDCQKKYIIKHAVVTMFFTTL